MLAMQVCTFLHCHVAQPGAAPGSPEPTSRTQPQGQPQIGPSSPTPDSTSIKVRALLISCLYVCKAQAILHHVAVQDIRCDRVMAGLVWWSGTHPDNFGMALLS